MVSRRLLRIKAMQVLYSYMQSTEKSINQAEKELFFSISKSYDLFFLHIALLAEMVKLAEEKIEKAKNKRLPTKEDLNPNRRFVDNKIIRQLTDNQQYIEYVQRQKLTWNTNEELVRSVFNTLMESELYQSYMSSAETSKYSDDQEFVIQIIESIFAENEYLVQALEEMSIYWNDDFEFVLSMLIKSIEGMKIGNTHMKRLVQTFSNEEDIDFAKNIIRKTLLNKKQYEELIDKHIKNWELERIAQMDILILLMAISEISNFELIPIKVSMNEYIELSKFYSTEKSSEFINGVLENCIEELKSNQKVKKVGRGLKE